jgi:hypothetical protein
LLAAWIGVGSFQMAEAKDPRVTKRKLQPAGQYKSPNNKIPKQKKYKAPKQKRVKYKH